MRLEHQEMKSMPEKPHHCDPDEIALKSFFLGPQAENAPWVKEFVLSIFEHWFSWRKSLFPGDGVAISKSNQTTLEFKKRQKKFKTLLDEALKRFENEVPKFSPRYIGHMFSEMSLPALLGHMITLLHNPNNVSEEASRVGVAFEKEAIGFLAKMVGYDPALTRGHFTSGGSIANFEAMRRARYRLDQWLSMGSYVQCRTHDRRNLFEWAHQGWESFEQLKSDYLPGNGHLRAWSFLESNPLSHAKKMGQLFGSAYLGPVILVPQTKHYSWVKGVDLFGLGKESFWPVELNDQGKMSIDSLKATVELARRNNRPILMVVSVAGTTELGELDPIDQVQNYLDELAETKRIHIWHHVDAAYGGFFCSLKEGVLDRSVESALKSIRRANSVTLDPHKLGYVPFSAGTFLAGDEREYEMPSCDAPYIRFASKNECGLHTIEGSRSAAGAVATWLTARTVGLNEEGYGKVLERTIKSRKSLSKLLSDSSDDIRIAPDLDTNICCFCVAKNDESLSETNKRSLKIFEKFSTKKKSPFFVSKTHLRWPAYKDYLDRYTSQWNSKLDQSELILIRIVLMNPFFDTIETNISFPKEFVSELKEFV